MSKKLVLLLTVMVLTFAPMSAYADDSIPIMKSLVFQLNQQRIIMDAFTNDADLVIKALQRYSEYGDNKEKLDQSFVLIKGTRDSIKDTNVYNSVNTGILELERAYNLAQINKKYPSKHNVQEYFKALDNAHTIFYNESMKASELYFQIYNNIMNF